MVVRMRIVGVMWADVDEVMMVMMMMVTMLMVV